MNPKLGTLPSQCRLSEVTLMTYVAIGTKIPPGKSVFRDLVWTTMCARLRSMSSMAILQQLARLKKSRPRARVAIRHQDRNSEESCSAGRRLTKRRIFIARYAYSHSPGAAAEWLVEFIENPQHTCWGRGIRRTQLLLCGRARARDVLHLGHIELSFCLCRRGTSCRPGLRSGRRGS